MIDSVSSKAFVLIHSFVHTKNGRIRRVNNKSWPQGVSGCIYSWGILTLFNAVKVHTYIEVLKVRVYPLLSINAGPHNLQHIGSFLGLNLSNKYLHTCALHPHTPQIEINSWELQQQKLVCVWFELWDLPPGTWQPLMLNKQGAR